MKSSLREREGAERREVRGEGGGEPGARERVEGRRRMEETGEGEGDGEKVEQVVIIVSWRRWTSSLCGRALRRVRRDRQDRQLGLGLD